jgi:hypothetical protein
MISMMIVAVMVGNGATLLFRVRFRHCRGDPRDDDGAHRHEHSGRNPRAAPNSACRDNSCPADLVARC